MKKKDLLQKIKNQALNEMPDVFNRINIDSIQIDDYEPETIRTPFNFKRAVSYTFASLFILVSGIMIYNFGYLSLINDSNPLETETEIIGFQTVSAASLLNVAEVSELNYFESDYVVTELSQSSSSIEDEIELINSYLNLAETVIASEQNYVYNDVDSDNQDYAFAFEYKAADLAGNLIVYRAYYNKETNQDGDVLINGIMINNDLEYSFSSSVIQNGETLYYQYRIETSNNQYVKVTNVSNDNLQKFTYQVYKNDSLSNSSEVTVHSYKNNITASMVITNKSNNQLTLDFERNTENFDNQEMQVKYSYKQGNNTENGEFKVNLVADTETGNYKYQYNFNNTNIIVTNRFEKGYIKANEDDFEKTRGQGNGNSITTTVSTEEVTTDEHTTERGHNSTNSNTTNPGNGTNNSHNGQSIEVDNEEQMEI
ncbi:MAG: hypothetical protein JEZ05_01975 [Tenericutes bacterium]|nr:hypothetical protein [Mycoplasmatota bacterium]